LSDNLNSSLFKNREIRRDFPKINADDFVKSPKSAFFVIPAKPVPVKTGSRNPVFS
jgi:hypothetical protein